jgi:LysR family transcriptional activator of nhaA
VPKLVAYRFIAPALELPEPVRLVCERGQPEELMARLAVRSPDVVLADAPASPALKIRAFSHLLGESSVSIVGTADLVAAYGVASPSR